MNDKSKCNDMSADEDFNVPPDFPRGSFTGALPGAQPKILANLYHGRYYEAGSSPPEVHERWSVCNDLANQLAVKAKESKIGKRSHMTELEILEHYHVRLLATKWTSAAEAMWVINQVAEQLEWNSIPK